MNGNFIPLVDTSNMEAVDNANIFLQVKLTRSAIHDRSTVVQGEGGRRLNLNQS